jgi:hypothetical protein
MQTQNDHVEIEPLEPSVATSMRWIRWFIVAATVFSFIASIAFFTWWGMKDYFVFGQKTFNRVEWITAQQTPDNRCHRGDMAYDLKTRVLEVGMSRDATTLLLGRPTWEDAGHAEYDLGYCHWSTHGLYLFFNEQNQLTQSRIAQH